MKKRNRSLAAVGLLLTLTACGQKQEENPIPSVLDDGVLVVGILDTEDRSCYRAADADGNPYYGGWEPNILTLLDEKMEEATLDYRFAQSKAELISWLNTGEIELAAGSFTRLDSYNNQYYLSDDYGFGSVYIVNKNNGYLDTLAAFQDETMGVSTQIPVNNLSQMAGMDRIVQNAYADPAVLAQDISTGVISGGICTEDEVMYILQNTDLQAAEMRSTPQLGMVFLSQVGQDDLMSWVNYAIDLYYYNLAKGNTGGDENAEGGQ
ncbi:MAG: transporter substrate-binding domain-containing protein [Lachnospiraceae bacterium]|nr:transporter substrate-binding domain-containing protein [Lachnospiraceae bacterium]